MTPTIEQDTTRTLTVPPKARRTSQRPVRGGKPLISYGQWWWALPAILLVLGVQYAATLTGGFFAFTNWTGIGSFEITGFDNFAKIFADPQLLGAVWNTLFLAFGSVIITNVLGLLFALAINRTLKTRYILRTLLFMPVVLSPLAVAYVWKFIFQFNGPLNGFLGAIGPEGGEGGGTEANCAVAWTNPFVTSLSPAPGSERLARLSLPRVQGGTHSSLFDIRFADVGQ